MNLNKVFSSILLFFLIFGLLPSQSFGNYSQNYFIVTAYYSPLPGQEYYLTGNYEDEKRLNGQGIRGASGKKVFSGMFAAPKKYAFGTKLFLKGYGAGSVEDRGGAIVPAGKRGYSYDRIDMWVGYGDEGLRRALYWGKRKVAGSIISGGSKITFDYKKIPSPKWATSGLRKISDIFSMNIGVKNDKKRVIALQKFLSKIGLYKGSLDGKYNKDIMNIIFEFQMRNKIISGENSLGAGYWGNKTRNLFLKKYLNGGFKSELKNTSDLKKENNKKYFLFSGPIDSEKKVRRLQDLLNELNLYSGKIDGKYKTIKNIILKYQLDYKIIQSNKSLGAGTFGPKTRKSLEKYYNQYKKEREREKDLENKFSDLEKITENEINIKMKNIGTPKFGEISLKVRELQKILKLLGFFNHKDTAFFGDITKQSIFKYQLENNLVVSENQTGAGVFGPKTKKTIKRDLKLLLLKEKVVEKKLDEKLLLKIGVWSL